MMATASAWASTSRPRTRSPCGLRAQQAQTAGGLTLARQRPGAGPIAGRSQGAHIDGGQHAWRSRPGCRSRPDRVDPQRSGLVSSDLQDPGLKAGLVDRLGHGCRPAPDLAGSDIELAAVPGASQAVADQLALGQRAASVAATIGQHPRRALAFTGGVRV